MSYVVRLFPDSYPEMKAAFDDLKVSAPRKMDQKVCGQIARKLEISQPRVGSDVGYTQMYLTSEEADYYNIIARALNIPGVRGELKD